MWLAIQSFVGLALVSIIVYSVISSHLSTRRDASIAEKQSLVHHLVLEARLNGDLNAFRHNLNDFMAGHQELALTIIDDTGTTLFQSDPPMIADVVKTLLEFPIRSLDDSHLTSTAILKHSGHADNELLQHLAITLFVVSLMGALCVSRGAYSLVRRGLKPVDNLAIQTTKLNARSISEQLDGSAQPSELQPLVTQFNALLTRLSTSYQRLESFNADVAHELNTPLTTLITSTEIALRKPYQADGLIDLLGSNLEELHRLSGIVRDMLFLSQAERGSRARCAPVASLASIAAEVADYHEAPLEEADLKVVITGDAAGEFDAPLLKRALSNLLGNAITYATKGTAIKIDINEIAEHRVSIAVSNQGTGIPPDKLPHVFERFFRVDTARSGADQHHGLGLSIVAGITQMHGGKTFAESANDNTRIGIALPLYAVTQQPHRPNKT
jgi:two-component system heavy metal sensor histidine kinase CusS